MLCRTFLAACFRSEYHGGGAAVFRIKLSQGDRSVRSPNPTKDDEYIALPSKRTATDGRLRYSENGSISSVKILSGLNLTSFFGKFRDIFWVVRFSTFATISPQQRTFVRYPLMSLR